MFTFYVENKALKFFKSLFKKDCLENLVIEKYWWRIGYGQARLFGDENRSCSCKTKYCKGHPVFTVEYKTSDFDFSKTISLKYNPVTTNFSF